jgi:hypothetical protein
VLIVEVKGVFFVLAMMIKMFGGTERPDSTIL